MIPILVILVLFEVGWLIRGRGEKSAGIRIGEGFLIACGSLYSIEGLLSLMKVRWSAPALGAGLALLTLLLFRRGRFRADPSLPPAEAGVRAVDLLIALTVAGYALRAFLTPMVQQDFVAIWGLKARVFFAGGAVDPGWLAHHPTSQPDYPLLLPLLLSGIAVFAGRWTDTGLGLLWAAFGASSILLLRGHLLRERENRIAVLATFALTAPLMSLWVGLAEGPLMAFLVAAVLRLRQGLREEDPGSIRLGALFAGLAAATKNEGLTLVCLILGAILILAEGRRMALHLWPVLIALPWVFLARFYGLHSYFADGGLLQRAVARIAHPTVILRSLVSYAPPKPVFYLAILVVLALTFRRVGRIDRAFLAAIMLQAILFVGAFLVTPFDPVAQIESSWGRILEPLGALAALIAVLAATATDSRDAGHHPNRFNASASAPTTNGEPA